jgi:two-component system, LytTR family, response regulator
MVLKTIIADDEPIARRVIREELEPFDSISIVGEAENGRQTLELIETMKPDLVFLDLQMPIMGGFEVVDNLRGGSLPVIVIVTAFDQYAIRAFEAGAVDYLLKPISAERLQRAIQRAHSLHGRGREIAENVARLSEIGDSPAVPKRRKIVGRSGEEFFLLDLDEILAFQADGELVWIVTSNQRFLATQPLRAFEESLCGFQFKRVRRNSIVNMNHVRKMSTMSSQRWLLTLSNAQELIVSKRLAHGLRSFLHWPAGR